MATELLSNQENRNQYLINHNPLVKFCQDKIPINSPFQIPCLTVIEVNKMISELKNKKSMGPDNIPVKLLKIAIPFIIGPLTYAYNLCISKNIFPSTLKIAKVIPIPKSKDVTNPLNFRPISILSSLSKPLENI